MLPFLQHPGGHRDLGSRPWPWAAPFCSPAALRLPVGSGGGGRTQTKSALWGLERRLPECPSRWWACSLELWFPDICQESTRSVTFFSFFFWCLTGKCRACPKLEQCRVASHHPSFGSSGLVTSLGTSTSSLSSPTPLFLFCFFF